MTILHEYRVSQTYVATAMAPSTTNSSRYPPSATVSDVISDNSGGLSRASTAATRNSAVAVVDPRIVGMIAAHVNASQIVRKDWQEIVKTRLNREYAGVPYYHDKRMGTLALAWRIGQNISVMDYALAQAFMDGKEDYEPYLKGKEIVPKSLPKDTRLYTDAPRFPNTPK